MTALTSHLKLLEAESIHIFREAAAQFRFYLERPGAVDERLADQIVLPLALASGPSEFTTVRVTEHLRTNVDVIQAFLERTVELDGKLGQPGRFMVR